MNHDAWWREFATPRFVISFLLIAVAAYATHIVLTGNYSADTKGLVIGAWVVTGVQEVRKFWLNSTSESEKKNETINSLVKGNGPQA